MITIYRLFQIIMGIALSVFILYFLIDYAGSYAGVGEVALRQKTLDVFLQDADNVYFSGNPIAFEEFSDDDYSSCHPRLGRIECFIDDQSLETEELLIPVFTRIGYGDVLISRGSLDLGWTSIGYVTALEELNVVFNPRQVDDDAWDAFKQAVSGFPDTTGYSPKVTFGLCNGGNIVESSGPDDPWERDYFNGIRQDDVYAMAACTASLPDNYILVTISSSCSGSLASSGICITPAVNGVGKAYISGHDTAFVYKDPADLLALITGSGREDVFGVHAGEDSWDFKNGFFLDSLAASAMIMERRCNTLRQSSGIREECRPKYQELQSSMQVIIPLSGGDPYDYGEMNQLSAALGAAGLVWEELVDMGCENSG